MPAADKTKMMRSSVAIFTGVAGAVAGTPVGYIDQEDGAQFELDKNTSVENVQGHDLPIAFMSRAKRAAITATFAQLEIANAETAYNETAVGQVITFGDPSANVILPTISVAAVGALADGTAYRYDIPYASTGTDSVETVLTQAEKSKLPVRFEAVSDENLTAFPTLTVGAGNLTATIAAGTFDRGSSAFIFVRGQASAADDLDDITGAPALVNGEILTLQMGGAEVITVKHVLTTIELQGAADFVMAAGDQLALQYFTVGTQWVEKSRFIATPA